MILDDPADVDAKWVRRQRLWCWRPRRGDPISNGTNTTATVVATGRHRAGSTTRRHRARLAEEADGNRTGLGGTRLDLSERLWHPTRPRQHVPPGSPGSAGGLASATGICMCCATQGASLMLAQGTDLYVVSEVLRPSSVAITKYVYGHLVKGQKRAAAARMSEALLTANGFRNGSQSPPAPGTGAGRPEKRGL
jgi:hypothetical protein